MTVWASRDARTLAALIAVGIVNHVVLGGSRVTVSLDALARGASPFTVGVLMALYALLPMFFAVAAGRLSDRIGVLTPMRLASSGLLIGAVLPVLMPGIGALFVSTAVVGMCFTVFQLATQQATGALGGTADRARNFSVLSMGYSISGLIGPLIAGVAIDHWGFRVTFAVLAVLPVLSIVVLASKHIYVPVPEPVPHASTPGGIAALLKQPILRRVLITNVFIAMGWDLHMIFVPIYGAKIGLSASEIGAVLATFAAATFVIRLLMPALLRRRTEQQLMTVSLCSAGAVYAAYSFATSPWILAALSFTLGLMLGSGQPVVMSLLHAHAPPGRIGEAVGVRMSLVQGVAVAAPLLFGALGTSLGLTPVFWMVGVCLAASGVVAGRR